MNTPDNAVSFEKDYILSCATLFSEVGFPKSAFIKMVGTEYASDIFELMYDGKLVITGNVFFYPQRDKRKKRINQEAKYHFFKGMINDLSAFIFSYVSSYGGELPNKQLDASTANAFFALRDLSQPNEDAEIKAKKYHRNLGIYICETLQRTIDKMPLDNVDARLTYTILGWYYGIIREQDQSEVFFRQAESLA